MDPPSYTADEKSPPSSTVQPNLPPTQPPPQQQEHQEQAAPPPPPPPTYRETINPAPTSQHLGLLPPSQPGNIQRFPPDPHRGRNLLHIYRDTLTSPNLTIRAADDTTVAYTVVANTGSIASEKPHMRFYRALTPTTAAADDEQTPQEQEPQQPPPPLQQVEIGTATFRPSSRTFDLTFFLLPHRSSSRGRMHTLRLLPESFPLVPQPPVSAG